MSEHMDSLPPPRKPDQFAIGESKVVVVAQPAVRTIMQSPPDIPYIPDGIYLEFVIFVRYILHGICYRTRLK